MMAIKNTFISLPTLSAYLPLNRNVNGRNIRPQFSRKQLPESPKTKDEEEPTLLLPRLRVSNVVLARSTVVLISLGFIDAGYSGDWSRIGVISKETEDFLKILAFVVVPLSVFIILSFSSKHEDQNA